MRPFYPILAISLLIGALPFSAAAQGGALQNESSERVRAPSTLHPAPLVAPQITIPLAKPRPLTVDPPALQGGKPAPPGGINDAAARCEAQADLQLRAQCRDRLARETPVRPPG
jgi:hypothetical protein